MTREYKVTITLPGSSLNHQVYNMLLEGKIDETTSSKSEEHYLQCVPVKIKYQDNLQGKVKPFFTDCIENKNDNLTCNIRGRPLDGKVTELEEFNAAIVKLPNKPNNKANETLSCHTVSTCDKMTVWNYDMPHGKGNDMLSRGLLYARLSKVAHSE